MQVKVQSGKYVVFVRKTFYDKNGKNPYEGDNVVAAFQTMVEAKEYIEKQDSPIVEESKKEAEIEDISDGVQVELMEEED